MRSRALVLLTAALALACGGDDDKADVGPGVSREGCEEPGSNSVKIGAYSCACEPGYDWCDESLENLDCCPVEDETTTGDGDGDPPAAPPDEACGEDQLEQLACVEGQADDPAASVVWACNGERWIEVPGYATFECLAEGKQFAYGCTSGPTFLCGYGPGSPCTLETSSAICVDEDIIDVCVWDRRTIDRCSRLCAELGAFGEGFTGGACQVETDTEPAVCVCE